TGRARAANACWSPTRTRTASRARSTPTSATSGSATRSRPRRLRIGAGTHESHARMRYVYECPVRWSDLDAFGHVNNARFLTLFEEVRVALMFVGARDAGLTSFESGIVVHRHEIDYVRPVDYGPMVRIEMWVSDLRASRFTVSYELFADDELA